MLLPGSLAAVMEDTVLDLLQTVSVNLTVDSLEIAVMISTLSVVSS